MQWCCECWRSLLREEGLKRSSENVEGPLGMAGVLDEVNRLVAGREVLELNWSRDGLRLHVVVLDGIVDGAPKEANLLFECVGGVMLPALPRWRP